MKKITIQASAALDCDENLSPQREIFMSSMDSIAFCVHLTDDNAYTIFNAMPENTLPPLPWGYFWARDNDRHTLIKDFCAPKYQFDVVLYGPNNKDQINFLLQQDGTTVYSFAHVLSTTSPSRDYPMSNNDYKVPGYDYTRVKYNSHVRGHLIDLRDTIKVGGKDTWSATDPRNFVPEPPEYEWGLGIRNQKVQSLRRMTTPMAYAQHTLYPDKPLKTQDGTWVPEEVYFTSFQIHDKNKRIYKPTQAININWDENLKRPSGTKVLDHATNHLTTSLEASPVVKLYDSSITDRTLRYESRTYKKTADGIAQGNIKARFKSAEFFQRYSAADREFEHANFKMQAGFTADDVDRPNTAISNVNRALDFADQLTDLDQKEQPLSEAMIKKGTTFFNTKIADTHWADEDIEDITDRLRYLAN